MRQNISFGGAFINHGDKFCERNVEFVEEGNEINIYTTKEIEENFELLTD